MNKVKVEKKSAESILEEETVNYGRSLLLLVECECNQIYSVT